MRISDWSSDVCSSDLFLSMFDFPLVQGNKATVFHDNNSVVITQSIAQKLFGDSNAIGETIIYFGTNFTVTGVLQNFPENSSLHYDALFPMGIYAQQFTANGGNGDWKTIDEDLGNFRYDTFVKLKPNANSEKVGDTFSTAYKKARNGDSDVAFRLQNLADIHLISEDGNNSARSEEHTSELQSLMRISYAVFCLKKKHDKTQIIYSHIV